MKVPTHFVGCVLGCAAVLGAASTVAVTAQARHGWEPTVHATAEPPHLRVLPWRGHRAALTLTFDDSSPSEADLALPVLDARGVKGTFFVTERNIVGDRAIATWAQAVRDGHELGNHTVDHCHGSDLGHGRCLSARGEIEWDNAFIVSTLGARDVYTFAYPYVDQHGGYKRVAESDFLLARAGKGGLVDALRTPDWYSMDARFIEPTRGETIADWDRWIDEADAQSKWLVLVFHSILPEQWCEGIAKESLAAIVDHAKDTTDLWIGTFVDVGAYLRAEHLFESLHPVTTGRGLSWRWTLPRHFPPGGSLVVSVDRGSLTQGGVPLARLDGNRYEVSLDAKELAWSASP